MLLILWVILIPKTTNPLAIDEYRSISMVGCIYEVISNLLTNRIKPQLTKLINETQSSFAHGRQIADGLIIA